MSRYPIVFAVAGVAALVGTTAWASQQLAAASGGTSPATAAAARCASSVPFTAGDTGYHTYRIPAVVATRKGTVLAFAEGRKNSAGDSGDIDTVLRRSF